jgi:adenylate kinase family enzyme
MTESVRRVHLLGSPGSGKTTVGIRTAKALNLPFVDLDDIYHQAGWQPMPDEDFRAELARLRSLPAVVTAGNYSSWWDVRFADGDILVFLSAPRLVCVGRILARSARIRLLRQYDLLPRNCRARPDQEPLRDYPEFLRYTWRFGDRRAEHFERLRQAGVERFVWLDGRTTVQALLADLESRRDDALLTRLESVPVARLR